METMIHVQFDNSMAWCFDTNDLTAMVIDKDPNAKDLVVGAQVVAKRPNESSHVEGKVKEVKEENGKKTFLIDFWDGVEHWNTLEQIRLLTTTKPGGIEPSAYCIWFSLDCFVLINVGITLINVGITLIYVRIT